MQRSCFPPKVLSQHWPPSLRWVQVPNPFPTIIATTRPSDSPAASARLRFALGHALPVAQVLILCTSTSSSRGRPSGRLQPTARRRGSPVLRRPDLPTGQSGVSQVTGPSSSAVPQSSTPPVPLRLAISASGSAAFRVGEPLSIRNEGFEAAFLRPTRSPDYASTAPSRIQLQVWLPVCWLHFDWVGLAPTGRLIRVLVYIQTSSPTGIAWSLPTKPLSYSFPTTWASTCDIWSWGLNSTILTASSTTTVCPEGQ